MRIVERPSPNFDDRNGVAPTILILHYTGMTSAEAALTRLTDPEAKVSAHYTVDEDGTVYRHVDEAKRAWHAGHAFWRGETDINARSIGVEIVNPGHEHGYRPFPDVQIEAVAALCRAIIARHDIDASDVLGHSDVACERRWYDPGELFPWKALAQAGIGLWPEPSDEDAVKAGGMNIERALHDYGYDPRFKLRTKLAAFQRHFAPETVLDGRAGETDSVTRARLYALLAEHVLEPDVRS